MAAHSHHLWPDVTFEAQMAAWQDAAALGRAVLPAAAIQQIEAGLSGYSLLQADITTGEVLNALELAMAQRGYVVTRAK